MDVDLRIAPSYPGAVAEYECREAAVYVGVPWSDWVDNMTGYERAAAVAHYRAQLLIRAHIDDAADTAAKRREARAARKKGSKGG